jgi:hypothetical protein
MKIDYGNHTASSVGSHVTIAPTLETLMRELHHRMPRISYVVRNVSQLEVYGVTVYHDYELVGVINIEHHHVEGVKFDSYNIKSERIHTKRKAKGSGSKNIKQTKHFKNAVKICMDSFKRTESNVIASKIVTEVGGDIQSMVNTAGAQGRGFLTGQYEAILSYLTGATPMSPELTEAIKVDGQARYDNLRIAKAVQHSFMANYGICIRIEKDGTLTVVDMNDMNVRMETTSTYDLPTNYQEKFAILKIMDYKQPIEHVGVKFEESPDLYFLVGGETITTC